MGSGGVVIAIYLIGLAAILIIAWNAVASEPTAHGQTFLIQMGCAVGVFWPLVLAYFVITSPWIALTWWKTRGER